jgi:transposase
MSTSYSLDLRTKIIDAIKNGSLQRNVAKRFKVSLSTVKRYWKLYKENGDLKPKKPAKTRPNKVEWSEVLEFVKNNNDKTLCEIGEKFKINPSSVFRILVSFNFTFKKNRFYTKKETKMNAKISLKKSIKSKVNN